MSMEKYLIYKHTFKGKNGDAVMKDLEAFCCYHNSTIVTVDHAVDPYHMAMQEGKRQALLYIKSRLIEPKPTQREMEIMEFD